MRYEKERHFPTMFRVLPYMNVNPIGPGWNYTSRLNKAGLTRNELPHVHRSRGSVSKRSPPIILERYEVWQGISGILAQALGDGSVFVVSALLFDQACVWLNDSAL